MRKSGYFTKTRAGRPGYLVLSGLLLCLLTLSHTSSYAFAGQQTITLNVQNVPLQKVFAEIEKQTHYSFLYMQAVVKNAKHVNVKVSNASIEKVLEMCFKDQPQLTYSIMDRVVVVKAKTAAEAPVKKEVEDPIDISGRVTDEEGKPLVGANVKVRGTNNGVVTDAEGRFVLKNVNENAVLEISYVGREVQTVNVRGQRMLAISLSQKQSMLDETVVIAYGTTTKRLNTGNVASVKAEDIAKQPVNNPLLALQGRVPGMEITQYSGVPGSDIKIRIRGQNSIINGNDPLYVVDGVPYISQLLPNIGNILGSGGINRGSGSPFSYINPADIESIEVLKDADATAIYGSRGANGVVLITTKKGRSGETKVDVNMQKGWGKVSNKMELLNTDQYLAMRKEALRNFNIASPTSADYDINGVWDTTRYTDWQNELIGGTASYTQVQANISGGNTTTQYLLGAGYHKETTVFPGNFNDQKTSLHFSINSNSNNKKLNIILTGNYLYDNNQLLNVDLTNHAITLAPNAPNIYNMDGTLNWAYNASGRSTWPNRQNPLGELHRRFNNRTYNLISNSVITYHIFRDLEIKSSFGYTSVQSTEILTLPFAAIDPTRWSLNQRSARYANNRISSWIIEPQLLYAKEIGKSKVSAMIGATFQKNSNDGEILDASGFNSDLVLEDVKSAPVVSVFSTVKSLYKYNAFFGKLNYNFQNRYLLNLTARRDGTTRFGPGNQFHNFGAIGIGWLFYKENIIQKSLHFISFGKLRASLGSSGNDQVGDYRFMDLYSSISAGNPYQGSNGLTINNLYNPDLAWEDTRKLEVGFELGLFNDRLLFTSSYFNNRSSNQLVSYPLPSTTGFLSVANNLPATVQNSGWELVLNSTNFKSHNVSWLSSINLTISRNKLLSFPDINSSTYANALVVGQPITIVKKYDFLGVNPTTGIYQFADKNGDATPNPDTTNAIVNAAPKFYGGFQNSFEFKGLELSVLFQFVKQIGNNYLFGRYPGSMGINQPISVLNRWQKTGEITNIQKLDPSFNISQQFENAVFYSNGSYSDASFIRLKNVSLSWLIPELWFRKYHLKSCKVYLQGQNLITFTKYIGLDPETQSSTSLPPLRILTFGIQITL